MEINAMDDLWHSLMELAKSQPLGAIGIIVAIWILPKAMEFLTSDRRQSATERDKVFELVLKVSNEFSERIKKLEIENATCQSQYISLLEDHNELKGKYQILEMEVNRALHGGQES